MSSLSIQNYEFLTNLLRLSKTRRKRTVPDDWTTGETVQHFTSLRSIALSYAGSRKFALDSSGDLALLGASDGKAGVFSIHQNKLLQEFDVGGSVTDALWVGAKAALGTSAGTVKIFENGVEISGFSAHAGEVTALALHPSEEILASVGIDKNYVFYDLKSTTKALQVSTGSGKAIDTMLESFSTLYL